MVECTFSTNFEYLLTRPGVLKMLTLVFGLFCLGLGVHAVEDSAYNKAVEEQLENEEYFVSSVVAAFVISIIYLGLHAFSDDLANNSTNRVVDTIYHGLAGKSLLVGGLLLILSAVHIQSLAVCRTFHLFSPSEHGEEVKCQLQSYKIVGGAFAIFNSILYEVAAYFIYTTKDLP